MSGFMLITGFDKNCSLDGEYGKVNKLPVRSESNTIVMLQAGSIPSNLLYPSCGNPNPRW
jgi:hypothetical protein